MEHAAAPGPPARDARRLVPPQSAQPAQAAPQPAARPVPAVPRAAGRTVGLQGAPGVVERVRGAHPDPEPAPPSPPPSPPPRRLPERHSVRDQVLCALREALMTGELEPGTVYSAPALAERFGVSATPVREAMQLLAREGAVEALPNRGFRVAERSSRDLAELAEVRALLEVPVLLRLARTLPAERWETLRPLVDAGLTAAGLGDRAAYAEADRAFHRGLLELSGNRQLAAVADELHQRAQRPATASACEGTGAAATAARLVTDAKEHARLLEALASADLAAAETLLRGHFRALT